MLTDIRNGNSYTKTLCSKVNKKPQLKSPLVVEIFSSRNRTLHLKKAMNVMYTYSAYIESSLNVSACPFSLKKLF